MTDKNGQTLPTIPAACSFLHEQVPSSLGTPEMICFRSEHHPHRNHLGTTGRPHTAHNHRWNFLEEIDDLLAGLHMANNPDSGIRFHRNFAFCLIGNRAAGKYGGSLSFGPLIIINKKNEKKKKRPIEAQLVTIRQYTAH